MFACIIAEIVFESFKTKRSTKLFVCSFTISLLGSIIIMFNDEKEYPVVDMIGYFICKFGIVSGF